MADKIILDARNSLLIGCWVVTFDGKDVTNECQIADETNGTVTLFKKNNNGKYLVENNCVVMAKLFGQVVISLRDDASDYAKEIYRQMREGVYNAR